jgi:hypothetical protein
LKFKVAFSVILAWISFVGVGYYLWTSIFFLNKLTFIHIPSLLLVMLLMPLNWSLESLKIYQKFNLNYSFKECVWITLKGLGLSLVTPMGMGVFVGRAMFEDQARRENLLTATAFSSYAQSMVTFGIGMFAFFKMGPFGEIGFTSELNNYLVINFLLFLVIAILFWIFLMNGKHLLRRIYMPKLPNSNDGTKIYTSLASLLLLSFVRYLVFGFQYLFLLMPFLFRRLERSHFSGSCYFYDSIHDRNSSNDFRTFQRGDCCMCTCTPFGIDLDVCLGIASTLFLINLILPALAGNFLLFGDLRTQYGFKLLTKE